MQNTRHLKTKMGIKRQLEKDGKIAKLKCRKAQQSPQLYVEPERKIKKNENRKKNICCPKLITQRLGPGHATPTAVPLCNLRLRCCPVCATKKST